MDLASSLNEHVRRIIKIHFDKCFGSPYWLDRQRELQINAIEDIRGFDDLKLLGPMDEAALSNRPVMDFVPLSMRSSLAGAIITDTAGTTGRPKRTIFTREEFQSAFVRPFVNMADNSGFPHGATWLFVGPSGPHVIGQAAEACAVAFNSHQPFTVDFDPRWFRKLPPESTGRERYLQHIIEQAVDILQSQRIEVLFTTPAIIWRLVEKMNDAERSRIRGVHYGGMKVGAEVLHKAQSEWFPDAVHLAGYGNSLFGVCMEAGGAATRALQYFPFGMRHQIRINQNGQVRMYRLDNSVLIVDLPERDFGAPASPPFQLRELGFGDGIEDPGPHEVNEKQELAIY